MDFFDWLLNSVQFLPIKKKKNVSVRLLERHDNSEESEVHLTPITEEEKLRNGSLLVRLSKKIASFSRAQFARFTLAGPISKGNGMVGFAHHHFLEIVPAGKSGPLCT